MSAIYTGPMTYWTTGARVLKIGLGQAQNSREVESRGNREWPLCSFAQDENLVIRILHRQALEIAEARLLPQLMG
jgi:hypothetical protein